MGVDTTLTVADVGAQHTPDHPWRIVDYRPSLTLEIYRDEEGVAAVVYHTINAAAVAAAVLGDGGVEDALGLVNDSDPDAVAAAVATDVAQRADDHGDGLGQSCITGRDVTVSCTFDLDDESARLFDTIDSRLDPLVETPRAGQCPNIMALAQRR